MNYEPIIGLEVHVELKTLSKMFCGCNAEYFGHEPNTHCCPVCLGLPGALPVPNKKAIEWCIMIGMALNCKVNEHSYFERKNYFYPDLPKGYQISQYAMPLSEEGYLDINNKKIRINRVHMEEDTGKLTHTKDMTLIDFNRSGVPLVEIVTEPDFTTTDEVTAYLKKLHQIIRYLGVSDADMEKGTMRLEPTINLKIKDSYTPLVEIKNINSFRFVKQALEYEMNRQVIEFETTGIEKNAGNKTTVGFNEEKRETYLQRSKEEANDYRYFPEPDIPPMRWNEDQILKIKDQIGELPDAKIARFIKEYVLSEYDATILCDSKVTADYFELCVKQDSVALKTIANWIINKKADINKVSPKELIELIRQKTQVAAISDLELEKIIRNIIDTNPKAVSDYKSGKENALMFLVGCVMRETKGSAQAEKVKEIIIKLL